MQLVDVGRQIISNRVSGFLNSKVLYFMANMHITPRPIWLTRHGQSSFNVEVCVCVCAADGAGACAERAMLRQSARGSLRQKRIGGDSLLSPLGLEYSSRLANFMGGQYPRGVDLQIWTSTLRCARGGGGTRDTHTGRHADARGYARRRTAQTAWPLHVHCGHAVIQVRAARGRGRGPATNASHGLNLPPQWRNLDEIDAGLRDGMKFAEVDPAETEARARAKFTYRYPRGESYEVRVAWGRVCVAIIATLVGHQDVVQRLEPVIVELMRCETPIL
jgi:broad specificity phosphatase PhoE